MRFLLENMEVLNSSVKQAFKSNLKYKVIAEQNTNLGLKQLLEQVSLDDILEAISLIQYDGISLTIQDNTKYSKILRYLEYGGQGVRPSNLISRTLKELSNGRQKGI